VAKVLQKSVGLPNQYKSGIFIRPTTKRIRMVSPKDNFTNEYTQEEINELKTAYDALATYKEKVRFFDDYFSIEVSGFIEQVEIFEFPFPSQGKHSKNDVERLEMILSSATASQFLEKTFLILPFRSSQPRQTSGFISIDIS
jgi:hypothetical protein